jgi:hypothetical protein
MAANELPLYLADVRLFDWLAAMQPGSVHGAWTVAEQRARARRAVPALIPEDAARRVVR